MPLDLAMRNAAPNFAKPALPEAWKGPLLRLSIAWAALFVLTLRDWLTMFDQWWNISTYNHVLFVPLIAGWLIYWRKQELAAIVPKAWWPGLLALAGSLFMWLLGSLAGVNTISQFGAVLALQSCVVALLGLRVAAACFFPLAYLLFLVPFGDELVPALQMITAKLVIALTEWSGIPAVIDGVFIDTPVGLFEVAEACSGVKFLVAMVALGILVAYTCFKSWKRRIIFMSAAVALPILANGIRAWGTIYIAQFQGVEFAEGFDHIFYGWVFFALVVGALLAGAWRWFDREPEEVGADFTQLVQLPWFSRIENAWMGQNSAVIGAMLLIVGIGAWQATASRVEASVPAQIALPEVAGWTRVDYTPVVAWEPKASGADHRLIGRYRNQDGQEVDVFFALYSAQEEGREASAFGEGALVPDTAWRWVEQGPSVAGAMSDYYLAFGQQKRLAQTSYRTGSILSGSALQLKLANMQDRLLLQDAPTMLLILSSEQNNDQSLEQSIANFRQSIGDEGEWMDRIAGLR